MGMVELPLPQAIAAALCHLAHIHGIPSDVHRLQSPLIFPIGKSGVGWHRKKECRSWQR